MKLPIITIQGTAFKIKYLDHFNSDENTKKKCTQEQIGFFVSEDKDYIFISLSKHEYDDNIVKFEEQVGIIKRCILEIEEV
jgi:hypothetical protein